jgi:hypothetical protein
MAQRLELQALLIQLLGSGNVYFQPPPTLKMRYPCIVYQRDAAKTVFADNMPYRNKTRYQVTVIDPNPDSVIPKLVAALPLCSYDRFFAADNLNHDVYNLFF